MSVTSAKMKLASAARDLRIKWEQASESWNDSASRAFEKNHVDPFESQVRSSLKAMETIGEVMTAVRRDCQDD
jgi:hypothetical protein